ncbi:MAG: septum formation initiator family protein [Patescibacteria group bacterium]
MITRNSKFGKKKKRLYENVVASAVFVVIFFGIMGFFVYQNVKMGQKRSALEDRLQELQAQMNELSTQRETLEANIANTQTKEYEEKVLREQGLYKKEGEQVVTVLPPEVATESVNPEETKKAKKWWNPWTW